MKILVHVEHHIIKRVPITTIQDTFFEYIDKLPEMIEGNVPKEVIKEKFTKGRDVFFNANKLSLLRNNRAFDFCEDSKETAYFFFKNGFIECTPDGYELLPYSKLKNYIWKEQIINHSFDKILSEKVSNGIFARFLLNVCNSDKERLDCMFSIVGYLLHSFYDYKLKAIVFTDSEISDMPNGRTGKTLLLEALKKVKPTSIINGKEFKPESQFKYQDVGLETKIVALNDVKSRFKLEDLFNDITDCIKVEKKNQKPFPIRAKVTISTNRTLQVEGASAKDRVVEFEFSNHYNENHSPADDFGKWFFNEWNVIEWNDFYNVMMHSVVVFFKNGMIKPISINLERRKLVDHTNEDFVRWMDEQVDTKAIQPGLEYVKSELYANFISSFPEYNEKGRKSIAQSIFTKFLKQYINNSGFFAPYKKEDSRRSSGKDYILFKVIEGAKIDIPDLPF